MDTDIRIPVTADQKQRISEAAAANPLGLAAWAREILIRAADEQLTSSKTKARNKATQNS